MNKTWAQRVRALRKRLSLTQEAFAQRLGVSFVSVSRWENKKTIPGRLARGAIATMEKR